MRYNFFRSELFKNTSVLVSGTALAQIIPIVLQPFLRRYYTPEDFGAYTVYLSLLGILIVIASFKYELSIILPKRDKDAANIILLSFIINLIFSLLLVLVIVFFKSQIADFLNIKGAYIFYLYMVPLGTFLFNFYQTLNYWLIRQKKFLDISISKIIRRSFEGVSQMGFYTINVSKGIILGDIIGHIANVIYALFKSFKVGLKMSYFSLAKIKFLSKKYIEYPKYNLIPGFMSACSYLLPAIFINKFFSPSHAGYFDLSKLVLSIPLALVATSISNVLLQRISEKYKKNESFIKELLPIILVVVLIAITEVIVIYFAGVPLFSIFFGSDWIVSGEISQVLVWSYSFSFIVASFSSVFISMKKIKLLSVWQLLYFISIISLVLFKNLNFTSFLKIYVIIELSCYLISLILIVFIVLRYEKAVRLMKN